MAHFEGRFPKPHILFSNCEPFINGIMSRAGYLSREDLKKIPERTCRTYIDKKGVKRSVGKKNMKESQCLDQIGGYSDKTHNSIYHI